MATLLLDTTSPAYVGEVFTVMEQPEMFDRFEQVLPTGERMWWDDTSHDWIAGVAGTGTPFYTRLVPGGLEKVPGLSDRLRRRAHRRYRVRCRRGRAAPGRAPSPVHDCRGRR